MEQSSKPDPYSEKRHWKWVVGQLAQVILPALLVLVAYVIMTANMGFNGFALVATVMFFILISLRVVGIWIAWSDRPIDVNPSNGTLTIWQGGYWWFLMSNSSPDTISLNDVKVTTTQSPLEQVFFHRSETLLIERVGDNNKDPKALVSVLDVERIVEIHKWWNGRSNALTERLLEEQVRTNELLERLMDQRPDEQY